MKATRAMALILTPFLVAPTGRTRPVSLGFGAQIRNPKSADNFAAARRNSGRPEALGCRPEGLRYGNLGQA